MTSEFASGVLAGVFGLAGLLLLVAFGAVKAIAFAKARKPKPEPFEQMNEAPL